MKDSEIVSLQSRRHVARAGTLALCAALGLLGTASHADVKAVYTTFDPPGSVNTQAWCMNDGGTIIGNYYDSGGASHGFIREADGTIVAFDPTGSIDTKTGYAHCINDKGWFTGSYEDTNDTWHGYASGGRAAGTFDPPGSIDTSPYGINSSGTIVGSYVDGNGVQHGFFRTADGTITSIDPPGSSWTLASQINRSGEIVGEYDGTNGIYLFVRSADGKYISSNPGDISSNIFATGINNDGTVTGSVSSNCGPYGFCTPGFVRTPSRAGAYTFTFFFARFPRHAYEPETFANCINNRGLIAGSYNTNLKPVHGFIRSADGTVRVFDPPGSIGTFINACDVNGDVAGYYLDSNNDSHGFLRTK